MSYGNEPRTERPPHVKPPMNVADRAKQFAPFAALGRLDRAFEIIEKKHDCGELERIEGTEIFDDFELLDGLDYFSDID